MRISELIKYLQKYQNDFGDVVLYSQKSDGRSTWNSPIKAKLTREDYWPDKPRQDKTYLLLDAGY